MRTPRTRDSGAAGASATTSAGAGGDGPGGFRRRGLYDSEELSLVLLSLIAEQPRHGYDLIREIEERTAGAYAPSPGIVYPTLTMLQDMGLIAEDDAAGTRKVYAVTAEGTALLAEKKEEVADLLARIAELEIRAKRRPRAGAPGAAQSPCGAVGKSLAFGQ